MVTEPQSHRATSRHEPRRPYSHRATRSRRAEMAQRALMCVRQTHILPSREACAPVATHACQSVGTPLCHPTHVCRFVTTSPSPHLHLDLCLYLCVAPHMYLGLHVYISVSPHTCISVCTHPYVCPCTGILCVWLHDCVVAGTDFVLWFRHYLHVAPSLPTCSSVTTHM